MSIPRRCLPDQTQFVTRRTRSRTAFLTPTSEVNQILLYALGVALEKFPGLQLHGLMIESTHHHCSVTDAPGESRLSDFFEEFHGLAARALNAHYGRDENLWCRPGSFNNVETHRNLDLEQQNACLQAWGW